MSQTTVPRTASPTPHRAVFAGVLLMLSGVMNVLQGITAIAKDDFYVHIGNYAYKFSLTSWGWIHLILGIAVAIVGWGAYAEPAGPASPVSPSSAWRCSATSCGCRISPGGP